MALTVSVFFLLSDCWPDFQSMFSPATHTRFELASLPDCSTIQELDGVTFPSLFLLSVFGKKLFTVAVTSLCFDHSENGIL